MPEDITLIRKYVIEEYLSNWFTYEELAKYLCLDINIIKDTLDVYSSFDKKLAKKIEQHKSYVEEYNNIELLGREEFITEENQLYVNIANYIIENKSSLRNTATHFGLGKTTIFDYVHEKLPKISIQLYKKVFDVLMENKSFAVDKKDIIEQVLKTYESFMRHNSCREVEEETGLSRNIVQRNLTTRLKLIDKVKYEQVKAKLEENQKRLLERNEIKK